MPGISLQSLDKYDLPLASLAQFSWGPNYNLLAADWLCEIAAADSCRTRDWPSSQQQWVCRRAYALYVLCNLKIKICGQMILVVTEFTYICFQYVRKPAYVCILLIYFLKRCWICLVFPRPCIVISLFSIKWKNDFGGWWGGGKQEKHGFLKLLKLL